MQVIETLADGLKRELKVVIPAKDMEARMNERLAETKDRVRINGFRPGKVPVAHLKKVYGKSIMAELVNELVRDKPVEILQERGEKSATQPDIAMTEDQAEAEKILSAEADFEFTLAYEVIPTFELKDVSGIKVTREVVDIADEEVTEQILKIAESARTYSDKDGAAENATASRSTISASSTASPSMAARTRTPNWFSAPTASSPASKSSWSAPRRATRR